MKEVCWTAGICCSISGKGYGCFANRLKGSSMGEPAQARPDLECESGSPQKVAETLTKWHPGWCSYPSVPECMDCVLVKCLENDLDKQVKNERLNDHYFATTVSITANKVIKMKLCVCACVCVREREWQKESEREEQKRDQTKMKKGNKWGKKRK